MNLDNLENKKVLILGFSTTGIACANYFALKGANVYISEFEPLKEKNKQKVEELEEKGVKIEFNGHSDEFINGAEFCILSPSIPDSAPILAK